jgi:hypothetical protein
MIKAEALAVGCCEAVVLFETGGVADGGWRQRQKSRMKRPHPFPQPPKELVTSRDLTVLAARC